MSSCMLKPIRSSGLWIPTNIPRTRIHAYQQFNIKTPTAARITSISTSIHRRHQTGQVPTQRPLQTLCFWKCRHTWKRATVNTTRCLIGCSLGDLSTMYYLMTYHPSMSTATSMSISMTAGISTSILLETVLLRLGKDRLAWIAAVRTACGMSLVSMLAMELTENLVTLGLVDRSMSLADPSFWAVTAVSMLAGFLAPLPYNYWRLKALGKACH